MRALLMIAVFLLFLILLAICVTAAEAATFHWQGDFTPVLVNQAKFERGVTFGLGGQLVGPVDSIDQSTFAATLTQVVNRSPDLPPLTADPWDFQFARPEGVNLTVVFYPRTPLWERADTFPNGEFDFVATFEAEGMVHSVSRPVHVATPEPGALAILAICLALGVIVKRQQ